MMMHKPSLLKGRERLAIARLNSTDEIPKMVKDSPFWSITITREEISMVLEEHYVLPNWKVDFGWRYLKVIGPLDFSLTGILSSILVPLAKAGISIFVISTYDTDYILVKDYLFEKAISVLNYDGYEIKNEFSD